MQTASTRCASHDPSDSGLHDPEALWTRSLPVVRSRDTTKLWMMRMLVRLRGDREFIQEFGYCSDELAERLGLPESLSLTEDPAIRLRRRALVRSMNAMEQRADQFKLPRILLHNLNLLEQQFQLSHADLQILALGILIGTDEDLAAAAGTVRSRTGVIGSIATILQLNRREVRRALAPNGLLRRSGLLRLVDSNDLASALETPRSTLRSIAFRRLASASHLAESLLRRAPPAELAPSDFAHLRPSFELLANLVHDAVSRHRRGVNVLLHGAPGVGKTQLVRTLAATTQLALYEVACEGDNGEAQDAATRLANTATAQHLLKRQKAVLLLDEIDSIFCDGNGFLGQKTTAERHKAWVNQLLEDNRVPTFWIANRLDAIDPAFVRRFDVVLEMKSPGRTQRAHLLRRASAGALDETQIRRFAEVDSITPAIVARSTKALRRMKVPRRDAAPVLETLIDGTLRAQRKRSIRRVVTGPVAELYDTSLCNSSADLEGIAQGIARTGQGRICLYGPPGTGKTAFGRWLAERCERPWLLKRMSDLQSPYLGVMERNLAAAFAEAVDEGALLQIDEVDSFLRDRTDARHSWEVSQVNEFLTQLEAFEGTFVASTNLMTAIDQAALRRFDYKIEFGYLSPIQSWQLLCRHLQHWAVPVPKDSTKTRRLLGALANLTPGDFSTLNRQHRLQPFTVADQVLDALALEARQKTPVRSPRMGFV